MSNKTKKINKYLIYDVLGMIGYGLILYFGFTWLAGFSLLYAYLWNFALIILGILMDLFAYKTMQSDKTITLINKNYDAEKVSRMLTGGFISFKTLLYLFYLFILVISQLIDFNPTLVGENLTDFIFANNYSILFLLALDTVIGQFAKDRERMKKISEKLNQSLSEKQE